MAIIYVDDAATGANDGTSLADAFTSFAGITVAARDQILIRDTHDETFGNLDFNTGVNDWYEIISINASEVYSPGASLTCTGTLGLACPYIRGVTFIISSDIDSAGQREPMIFEDCDITVDSIASSSTGDVVLKNCVVSITDTTFGISVQRFRMLGGSISSTSLGAGDGLLLSSNFDTTYHELIGVNLSGITNADALADFATAIGVEDRGRFVNCRLPTGVDLLIRGTRPTFVLEVIGCEVGTITDPSVQYHYETFEGRCESDTAVTRTGGASDGTTAYTMKLTALANTSVERHFGAVNGLYGITRWVEPGDTNLRVYFAHDAVGQGTAGALDTSECWIEYMGPSEAVTADTQAAFLSSTRAVFGATPTDLTTDTSTWSGTGVGTEQRIDIAIDPTEAGYATVWVHFAPGAASDTVIHFDPKIEVT